jgi:uncharacterized protein YndB with AHSA1/START domain
MKHPYWALILLLVLPAFVRTQQSQQPKGGPDVVKVNKITIPKKELRFEVEVPASVDAVWEAMTTAQGMMTWITPDARVDLRAGGDWLAMFPGAAPGGGTVISFQPKTRLELSAMAPEKFPTVRRDRTNALFEFESVGPSTTLVRLTQTGWKDGPEWDAAFDYLASGNAILLTMLRQRFISGPTDWKALFGQKDAKRG